MLLYLITNTVNKKEYVGMTSTSLERRFSEHRYSAAKNPKTPLHLAMVKHGVENFSIKLIGKVTTRDNLGVIERAEIARRKTRAPGGYNVTEGGDGQSPGYKPSPATLEKQRAGTKTCWANMTPEERAARGAAISAAKKGKPRRSPVGYVHPAKGFKRSDEFRAKVSAGMKRMIATLPPGEMARRAKCVKEPK